MVRMEGKGTCGRDEWGSRLRRVEVRGEEREKAPGEREALMAATRGEGGE